MHTLFALLASWGYFILAAFVVAEQVPLPVPAVPVLLGIGALAADGRMSIVAALAIACAAAVPMDLLWRRLGAVRGIPALRFMCRLSLEPASCIRRTESFFERYGSPVLLIAKFVPGLTALAPALAGLGKVPLARFLVLDIAGVVFWAGTWMSLGYLSGRSPEFIVALTSRAGSLLAGLATGFMIYMLLKIVRRRGFPRHFRMSRITASKPKSLLDRGEDVWIPDLRPGPEAEESLGGAAVDDTPWPGRARRCDTRRPRADGSVLLVKALGGGWDVAARLKPE
jgi:membrane protein DedA with SNARE-associated domain